MLRPRVLSVTNLGRNVARSQGLASSQLAHYGRTAAYRRLLSQSHFTDKNVCSLTSPTLLFSSPSLRSQLQPKTLASTPVLPNQTLSRPFHSAPSRFQQAAPKEDIRDPPRAEAEPEKSADSENKSSTEGETKSEEKAEESESDQNSKDKDEKGKDDKKDEPPPPPHGDKTPWQVFRDTMKSEFQASKEWNESTKQLASSAHQFTESEGVRKARAAYDATAGAATTKTAEALKSTASAIGTGAAWTWDSKVVQGVRGGVNAAGRGIEKATRPVRETQAFQNIKEVVDDGSSSRYGGWLEKEERRKRKAARDLKDGYRRAEKIEEDPNAGTNITLHKDAAWKESWNKFKDNSNLMRSLFAMRNTYEESENPLISTARSITDRFAGFFAENETAMVVKKFREMDPNFQMEPFLRDMREYILPEVLDAYVKGDVATLKLWLSAAQFQVYSALMQQYTTAGLKSDGRILDIRHVDVLNARMLEPGSIPVFIITCRTQEVHVYRNAKTNQLAAGMEDKVQLVTYAIGVTRLPEEVNNPETRGWRMIEMQKAGRDYI